MQDAQALSLNVQAKAVDKALEVFQAMKAQPDVEANCISYSALISACGTCGRWEQALGVFNEMSEAAKTDPECQPNTITYSALISACERGGRLDKALEVKPWPSSGMGRDRFIVALPMPGNWVMLNWLPLLLRSTTACARRVLKPT